MVGKVTPNNQLSASEIPVLMGCSRFKTPSELLKDKMDFISGIEAPFISNEAMTFGTLAEPMILQESALRLGYDNAKILHPEAYHHKSLPFACSLDGTVEGSGEELLTNVQHGIYCVNSDSIKMEGLGILEAKLTAHEPENPSEIPLYRGVLQLQMQMDTTGAKWGAICILYKGTQLRLFIYNRDEELIAEMHKAILDFQRRLDKWKSDGEIEWYPSQNPAEASRIFNHPEKETVSLDYFEDSAETIWQLRNEIKEKEALISKTELEIMEHMHDFEYAVAGKFKIDWKMLDYKPTAERVVPAKPARSIRQSKLKIRYVEVA